MSTCSSLHVFRSTMRLLALLSLLPLLAAGQSLVLIGGSLTSDATFWEKAIELAVSKTVNISFDL